MRRQLIGLAVLVASSCSREDGEAKKEAERLRAEMEAMKAEQAQARNDSDKKEVERLRAEMEAMKTEQARNADKMDTAKTEQATPTRLVDDSFTIKEGAGQIWRLTPGTYRVRVVSSPDGAKTYWSGAPDCPKSKGEQREFETRCIVSGDAQLNVDNPGSWGVGPAIVATVIVERLP